MSSSSAIEPASVGGIAGTFDHVARRYGAKDALVWDGGRLSYQALADASNRVAHGLHAAGIGRGDRVLLALERSADAVIAMLGVLKRGAVFVPLDPGVPEAYRQRIVETARAACVLSHAGWPHKAELAALPVPIPLRRLDDGWLSDQADGAVVSPATAHDAAYVMFTSGSTGKPKGVVAAHRGVTRLVLNADYMSIQPDDVFLQLAPLSFDASTFEIWGALLNGATLAIMKPGPVGLDDIAAALARYGVTILWLTAGLFHLMVDARPEGLRHLRWLLAGGDVLLPGHVRRAAALLDNGCIVNGYGPTENTTFSACHVVSAANLPDGADVPIGRAIHGSTAHVLDGAMIPVPSGELYVGGLGLALGYLDNEEATAQAFVPAPAHIELPEGAPRLLYRTGDLVRIDEQGLLRFIGRADDQVKISGHRIELAVVRQAVADLPGVVQAEIVVRQITDAAQPGGMRKELCGFVVADADWSEAEARRLLALSLPPAMRLARIARVDAMPLGPTAKIDRKALLALLDRQDAALPQRGLDEAVDRIAAIWARYLGRTEIPHEVNFFELGGSSLDLIGVHAALEEAFPGRFALTDLFDHSTVTALARKLAPKTEAAPAVTRERRRMDGPIAIIGMAGRFPGAATPEQFWRNLAAGVESISHFSAEEIEDALGRELKDDPRYIRARAILGDIAGFDAGFFGFLPREADLTDPQQRLFLEIAWEAFEDAGYDPKHAGTVGVFAGASVPTYLINNVLSDPARRREFTGAYQTGAFQSLTGNGADFLATRVAYKLDLRGPAMTVQSACSTSLLAVAQACQSLAAGQCDMALAGGVSITVPERRGYLHQEGGMVSPDGHCRPFDARAAGTVFGNGAGAVLLKRLDDALADGDHIRAVIRGAGITNDGAAKVGYAAPSVAGQAEAIRRAHRAADVSPDTISYVECHGTATPLGDPIEIAALSEAFGGIGGICALGSAKSNIGHLDVAAGITGLIKTTLSLEKKALPPLLHWRAPNPAIDFTQTPFRPQAHYTAWEAEGPRRAGVSAFGVGGTNVHLVVEEAPLRATNSQSTDFQLIAISARSETALADTAMRLGDHIEARLGQDLPDIAYTLRHGRRAFRHRAMIVARGDEAGRAAVVAALRLLNGPTGIAEERRGGVAFMFPGQGSQHAGMGRALYRDFPVYADAIDACAAVLAPVLGLDLRDILHADPDDDASARLRETRLAQPALFASSWALAKLWQSLGIAPTAMIGHSVGELVAACIAGVMPFDAALRFVAARGAAMQAMPAGRMVAVRLAPDQLAKHLVDGIDIAAVNGPQSCVVAGPEVAIAGLEAILTERGASCRTLRTSHAFHSAMMAPAVDALLALARELPLQPPAMSIVSTVTGDWLTAAEATDPAYWARHIRVPVRFADALATLMAARDAPALLEVGAGRVLTGLARQAGHRGTLIVNSLADPADGQPDRACLLEALGRLWVAGYPVDWTGLPSAGRRVPLPTYAFERQRHWIEAAPYQPVPAMPMPTNLPTALESPTMSVAAAAPASITAIGEGRDAAVTAGLAAAIRGLLEEVSGVDMAGMDGGLSFLELGFDSLLLTQITQSVRSRFGVEVAFRQLSTDITSPDALATYIRRHAPASVMDALAPAPVATAVAQPMAMPVMPMVPAAGGDAVQQLMREQLAAFQGLMQAQLTALGGAVAAPQPVAVAAPAMANPVQAEEPSKAQHGPFKPFEVSRLAMTETQRRFVDGLVARNVARTPGSKAIAQQHRDVLADPRVAAGYRVDWKEMIYPLATSRSAGSRIWDVDGNAYIDLLNGFGPTAFGHAPDFVRKALAAQLDHGFEIGPMTPLAGEAAALIHELTGNERVTFCNTGSEAVMAAMRIARTVTGRSKIATFSGDYHGQFDEVLVKGFVRDGQARVSPIAPGIPKESVANMVLLEHNAPQSLAWLRANAHELAAVLIEPVQSRHPGADTRAFLHELRRITQESGAVFILDEIVTGFRVHAGGAQAVFDLRADLVTYGKVLGGGMPIGVLAGKAEYMNALDGGSWCYGDDSGPTAGVTFFAGTFVRHPLTLAAVKAVLTHIKTEGPALQAGLNQRTTEMVARLNTVFARVGAPTKVENFGSVLYFKFPPENRFATLFWYLLREKGVHHQEGFPAFLTTAHSAADIDHIVEAFSYAAEAMRAAGCFGEVVAATRPADSALAATPVTGRPTEAQMEIWLASQFGPAASCAFNESVTLVLHGALDTESLTRALAKLMQRHDALRLCFSRTGERFEILAEVEPDLIVHELESLSPHARAGHFSDLVREEAEHAFDLVNGPLIRFVLARDLAPDTHTLIITAHHIICDGWSVNVLCDELGTLYGAEWKGVAPNLPPAPSFAAYAALPPTDASADAEAYWLDRYKTLPDALELPSDRPRPIDKSYRGGTCRLEIEGARLAVLKRAGAKRGATLFSVLFSGFAALMARLSGQGDITIGVPTAAQSALAPQGLVGHCVNFLPLRVDIGVEMPFSTLVADAKATLLEAYEHQSCTFGTLVRRLGVPRAPGRLPLIDVQFNLEKIGSDLAFPGLEASIDANPKRFANFDLFLNAVEAPDRLIMDCDYNADLFDAATIRRWLGHLSTLLDAVAEDMDRLVGILPLMDAAQRQAVLNAMTGPQRSLPPITVHRLIELQAEATPQAVAVRCGDRHLSYAELDTAADRLADRLGAMGVGPGEPVGVLLDRSIDLVVGLLGVLKLGAFYVPLDPANPVSRTDFVIGDSGISVLVANAATAGLLSHAGMSVPHALRIIDIADDRRPVSVRGVKSGSPHDLAYRIYTSGSTGKPKGVDIEQRALVNLLLSMSEAPGLGAGDTLLAVTTPSFDIAALELFLPLISGATLAIAKAEDVRDGNLLRLALEASHATMMQATPASWWMLLEAGWQPGPGCRMLCGGERLTQALAARLLDGGGVLWNMYGPTETTVWSIVERVTDADSIDFGKPIANTTCVVLDETMNPLPAGIPGELCIGGAGLARGYHRRDTLTAEKFVVPAYDGAERLYRTGDRAVLRPDGRLVLLGRLDDQVKLRGYRIELGEVEAAIFRATGGKQNAVRLIEPAEGDAYLAAYIEGGLAASDGMNKLRQALSLDLPGWMVPTRIVGLEKLPRTANNKLDRKALPVPVATTMRIVTPPRTPLEQKLLAIWQEVLGQRDIGVTDALFSLGADSIQAFRIVARADREGLEFDAAMLLRLRTIEALAQHLVSVVPTPATASEDPLPTAIRKPSGPAIRRASREAFRIDTRS